MAKEKNKEPLYKEYAQKTKKKKSVPHYYGDTVRTLFMFAGLVMVVTTPMFSTFLPASTLISLGAMIVVAISAGLTNPEQEWVLLLNSLVAVGAFGIFEFYAVDAYQADTNIMYTYLFWINQLLAVTFFVAMYYASKSLRGQLLKKK